MSGASISILSWELLKRILVERPEFKVIVSSATINTRIFSEFFNGAPIISIDARIHPVDIQYRPLKHPDQSDELFDTIVDTVAEQAKKPSGDILISPSRR